MARSLQNPANFPQSHKRGKIRGSDAKVQAQAQARDGKPRQRNSLACQRCRKRKIKCEGDTDGRGCQACRSSNALNCNYLRVNSGEIIEINSPSSSYSTPPEWTYCVPTAADSSYSMVTNPSDLSQYHVQPSTARASYHSSANTSTGAFHGMSSLPYTPMQPRAQHSSDLYSGAGAEHYGMHHTHGGSSGYHSPESSASWTPHWANSGPHARNMAAGQGFQNNYGAPAFSDQLLSATSTPAVTAEGSSYFPGLSPLATNLPASGSSGRMLLPSPAGLLAPITSSHSPSQASVNSTPTVYTPESSIQSNDSWEMDHVLAGTSQSSISTPSGMNSISPRSPTEIRRATTSSYVPIISRTAPRKMPSSYSSTPHAAVIDQGAARPGATQTDQSHDTRLPALTSSIDHRQYPIPGHDGINDSTEATDCEPNRASGQHILHPQPPQSPSYDALLKTPSKQNTKSARKSPRSGNRDRNQER